MKSSRLVLCALGLALAAPALAPSPASPAAGSRVRIVGESAQTLGEGTLLRLTADTVVLGDGHRQQAIALTGDRRLERFVGRQRQTGKGALYGGLAGVALGVVSGAESGSRCDGFICLGPVAGALLGGAVLGLTGAVAGIIIGALDTSDVWEPVPASGPRVTVSRTPSSRWGFGAAIAF